MKLFFQVSLLGLLAASCGGNAGYMTLGDVEIVEEFPTELTLPETEPYMAEFPGVVSFKGIDSLFIGVCNNTDYNFGLYSLIDGEKLADMFRIGQGPGEYSGSMTVADIYSRGDSLYADIRESSKRILRVNLTATAAEGREVVDSIYSPSFMPGSKTMISLGADTFAAYYGSYDFPATVRCLIDSAGKREIVGMQSVNEGWQGVNPNSIAGIMAVLPGDSVVVEAMIRLNQILVYSVRDESVRKTICVGGNRTLVPEDSRAAKLNQLGAYSGVQVADNIVYLLYYDGKFKDYSENKGHSEIQIFDTAMQPVARLSLPTVAQGFYVSPAGELYVLNPLGDSEYFYRWDISDVANQKL